MQIIRSMLSCLLLAGALLCSSCTRSQVKVGDKVPAFQLKDQDGNLFDLAAVLGRQPLVIYVINQFNSMFNAEKHVTTALRAITN